jgi:hypothetical protein
LNTEERKVGSVGDVILSPTINTTLHCLPFFNSLIINLFICNKEFDKMSKIKLIVRFTFFDTLGSQNEFKHTITLNLITLEDITFCVLLLIR